MAGEWLAIMANLAFVISNVLFRKSEYQASPKFINTFRTFIGTITFTVIALILGIFSNIIKLPWLLWIILILSFIFGQVIGDTSYFEAQRKIGATKAMSISMTFPVFTYILSIFFLDQQFELKFVFSFLLICVGIIIIGNTKDSMRKPIEIINSNEKDFKLEFMSIIFALLASIGWAVGLVLIDYATNEIDRLLDLGSQSSIIGNVIRFPAALLILFFMLLHDEKRPLTGKSKSTWGWLFAAALIGTSLGAYFFTEAARVAGATVMALIASANPLFSLPLSYFLNKEKISLLGFFGVILTISGVIIIII